MSPQNVRLIRSIAVCARMPGRQMDGAVSVFLSDPLISITHSPRWRCPVLQRSTDEAIHWVASR